MPLILAIVAGVVLFCGGIGAGVYFLAIAPRADMARRVERDNREAEANGKVTKTKLYQLRAGMTKSQVEAVLGPGRLADWSDVVSSAGALDNAHDIELRWQPARERKLVYVWDEFADRILVAYSADPGGTVVGILAKIDTSRTYTEAVRLNAPPGGR